MAEQSEKKSTKVLSFDCDVQLDKLNASTSSKYRIWLQRNVANRYFSLVSKPNELLLKHLFKSCSVIVTQGCDYISTTVFEITIANSNPECNGDS